MDILQPERIGTPVRQSAIRNLQSTIVSGGDQHDGGVPCGARPATLRLTNYRYETRISLAGRCEQRPPIRYEGRNSSAWSGEGALPGTRAVDCGFGLRPMLSLVKGWRTPLPPPLRSRVTYRIRWVPGREHSAPVLRDRRRAQPARQQLRRSAAVPNRQWCVHPGNRTSPAEAGHGRSRLP